MENYQTVGIKNHQPIQNTIINRNKQLEKLVPVETGPVRIMQDEPMIEDTEEADQTERRSQLFTPSKNA